MSGFIPLVQFHSLFMFPVSLQCLYTNNQTTKPIQKCARGQSNILTHIRPSTQPLEQIPYPHLTQTETILVYNVSLYMTTGKRPRICHLLLLAASLRVSQHHIYQNHRQQRRACTWSIHAVPTVGLAIEVMAKH